MLRRTDPRILRMRAGITAQTVADAFGLERAQVSRWETKRQIPRSPAGWRWVRLMAALERRAQVLAEEPAANVRGPR